LCSGVEHRFDKSLKNATGKDTSIPENLARLRALHHNTRQIVHHNLQHTADLKEDENRKADQSDQINQRVWHYIDAKRETNWKFGPSWEKAIIVGIPSTATYRIRREAGRKKVRNVNMQKLKPRHCGDGEVPPVQYKEEPGRDTKRRRIKEESKSEDKNVIEENANHKHQMNNNNKKHKSKTKRKKIEETKNSKTPNRNTQKKIQQNRKTKKMKRTRNATI
jgi:hypothetical protein